MLTRRDVLQKCIALGSVVMPGFLLVASTCGTLIAPSASLAQVEPSVIHEHGAVACIESPTPGKRPPNADWAILLQRTFSPLPTSPLVWRFENISTLKAAQDEASQAPNQSTRHVPVVEELVQLMQARPDLRAALEDAIRTANLKGIENTEAFLDLLDDLVTAVPNYPETRPKYLKIYYIIDEAPDDRLNGDERFNAWMKKYVEALGEFLDTPASAAAIPSYTALPNYHIDDYFVGPSGWLTFNQFFAREVKPGKRPIAEPRNDKAIVSPADSVFLGKWDIDANSKVTVKGVTWPIAKLLDGSPYQNAFEGGIYTHMFLNADDYHRYHVPVAGEIKEVRKIQGRVYLNLIRKADGSLQGIDGDTYQYNQERGLIVIDSPEVGLVAVLPIGMGVVSSVNLTPEVGARLQKGDEFGFFMFGGSDIVMLFQNKKVAIDAEVGKKYLQGQRIGEIR